MHHIFQPDDVFVVKRPDIAYFADDPIPQPRLILVILLHLLERKRNLRLGVLDLVHVPKGPASQLGEHSVPVNRICEGKEWMKAKGSWDLWVESAIIWVSCVSTSFNSLVSCSDIPQNKGGVAFVLSSSELFGEKGG